MKPAHIAGVFILLILIIAGVGAVLLSLESAATPAIVLSREFTSNAFRFRYPKDWQYQIPRQNTLFLVSPELLAQQAGASVAIQRGIRFSDGIDTLESVMTVYLERGPLRPDRAWAKAGAIEAATFAGRDALFMAVEGAEIAGTTPMRSEITVTQAQSGYFYIFSVTAPLDQWETLEPTFAAILASVEILE
jgi:hypothetical protein